MDKSKFDSVYPIICSALVEKIAAKLKLSDKDAVTELYSSHLYEILEQKNIAIILRSSQIMIMTDF